MPFAEALCPYCRVELRKRPQRKTKCPGCGNSIMVRTEPATGERVGLTEAEAARIDSVHAAQYALRYLERQVESFDLEVGEYRRRTAARPDLPPRDVVWGMCNERLTRLNFAGEWHIAGALYYGMALFAAEEDSEFTYLLEACAAMKLRGFQLQGGVRKVEILTAGIGNACKFCARLERKVFTLEDAARTRPLPCRECTMVVVGAQAGFCRCDYLPRD